VLVARTRRCRHLTFDADRAGRTARVLGGGVGLAREAPALAVHPSTGTGCRREAIDEPC
jgi:hypothetical protein